MSRNNIPVLQVVDVHPAVQMELAGWEVELILHALQAVEHLATNHSGLTLYGMPLEPEELNSLIPRMRSARDAIYMKYGTVEGGRRVEAT